MSNKHTGPRIIGVVGEPEAGKDFMSSLLAWFFSDTTPYRIMRAGQVFREYVGVERFLKDDAPHAPTAMNPAIEAMIKYSLYKYSRIIAVGVPRNLRQVSFLKKLVDTKTADVLVVHVKGKWKRKQSAESAELAERIRQSQYLDSVLAAISHSRLPMVELWNYREIGLPDQEVIKALEIPSAELWNAARPHIPG